jgi:hypothetical protein
MHFFRAVTYLQEVHPSITPRYSSGEPAEKICTHWHTEKKQTDKGVGRRNDTDEKVTERDPAEGKKGRTQGGSE